MADIFIWIDAHHWVVFLLIAACAIVDIISYGRNHP
jgi:hypothetical protein